MAKKKTAKKSAKKTVKKATPKATKKTASKRAAPKKPAVKKASKREATYKLKVGDAAPKFEAPATSGRTLKLSDFGGKKLVLYFYPKDNTPGCTLEGQDFRRLKDKFAAAGCEIVGVSQDSVRSHEGFKSKCGFNFELLSDEKGEVCKAFDVIQMKSMYGRDFMGIERSTFLIDGQGKVRAEWRKVKVTGHADEVLEVAKGL
jgi:thioredoxin-dependent peroxiredoxin